MMKFQDKLIFDICYPKNIVHIAMRSFIKGLFFFLMYYGLHRGSFFNPSLINYCVFAIYYLLFYSWSLVF